MSEITSEDSEGEPTNTIFKHLIIENPPDVKKRKSEGNELAELNMRQTKRRTSQVNQVPFQVATSNRYTPLSENNNNDDPGSNTDTTTVETMKKTKPPTPIIIPGRVANHAELVQKIQKIAKHKFYIKYTKNNTDIYMSDIEDKNLFKEIILKEKIKHHSYTDAKDKTHAFVVRGLDSEPTEAEVKAELLHLELDVKAVFRLKGTARALYMATFSPDTRLTYLETKARYLLHTRVHWERHINKKILTQCHRCQKWGHATSNCYRDPYCVKCGQGHLTVECKKPRETPPTCANCGEEHTANNIECKHYEYALRRRQMQQESRKPKPRFIPAPQPSTNIWSQREFPQLVPSYPPPQQQQQAVSASAITSVVTSAVRAPPTMCAQSQQSQVQFLDIISELKQLQQKVNLTSMLTAIKDLNTAMSTCTDGQEKFTTFLTFIQNVDKYNL